MARLKVTYYLDATLVKLVRLIAVATDRHDYQVIEEALGAYTQSAAAQGLPSEVAGLFKPPTLLEPMDEEGAVQLAEDAFEHSERTARARGGAVASH